jgi:hypothetical protein
MILEASRSGSGRDRSYLTQFGRPDIALDAMLEPYLAIFRPIYRNLDTFQ